MHSLPQPTHHTLADLQAHAPAPSTVGPFACTCPLSSTVTVARGRGRGRGRDVVRRTCNCQSKERKDDSNASLTRDLANQKRKRQNYQKRGVLSE